MDAHEFEKLESAERKLLADTIAKVKGEAALRELLLKIIALPRHQVFGSIVIQSGALRRAVTGEQLTEAQHTQLPSNTRIYKVSYRTQGATRILTAEVIARSLAEAKQKQLARFKSNNPKGTVCEIVDVVPMINQRGFTK